MGRELFACGECGYRSPKWLGRCPECGSWNSLTAVASASQARSVEPGVEPVRLVDVRPTGAERTPTGVDELDRVLGGGLVSGMAVLLAGEPGVGKSTLVLQAAASLTRSGRSVVYVSGEESPAQLRLRADRLGVDGSGLSVLVETDVDTVAAVLRRHPQAIAVVDSIQTVRCSDLPALPGSVAQVRESAGRLVEMAKDTGVPLLLVGHVTKDGAVAGPRTLEHVVDTVLQFEGTRHQSHRVLRTLKNRFGSAEELGVFSMRESGLVGVANPSELFLAGRPRSAPGSTILPAVEGTRPLLLEIQALVGDEVQGSPRRTSLGFDGSRVALILAVLQRSAGLALTGRDVFVNVAGGISVQEPAADLAVAAAIASSYRGVPLPDRWVVLGEVGLTGEVRSVGRVEARLREAERMGFEAAVLPAGAEAGSAGIRLHRAATVSQALELLS